MTREKQHELNVRIDECELLEIDLVAPHVAGDAVKIAELLEKRSGQYLGDVDNADSAIRADEVDQVGRLLLNAGGSVEPLVLVITLQSRIQGYRSHIMRAIQEKKAK